MYLKNIPHLPNMRDMRGYTVHSAQKTFANFVKYFFCEKMQIEANPLTFTRKCSIIMSVDVRLMAGGCNFRSVALRLLVNFRRSMSDI